MNKIKEITEQTVAAEKEKKKKDICRHVFYSVAEIRAGGDNRVKKGREAKYWIYKRTRLNIIIYSWKVVERRTAVRGCGREEAQKDPGRNGIFLFEHVFECSIRQEHRVQK